MGTRRAAGGGDAAGGASTSPGGEPGRRPLLKKKEPRARPVPVLALLAFFTLSPAVVMVVRFQPGDDDAPWPRPAAASAAAASR